MSLLQSTPEIEYPESDGLPMGETDVHIKATWDIYRRLEYRYRRDRVYLASNLLVYYEEGDNEKVVVPDVFVVRDHNPGNRRTYKIWEEGKPPQVVFEVTSKSSSVDDIKSKPPLYAELGVSEVFCYDPMEEYLRPPLRGFRLVDGSYRELVADAAGYLESRDLDIKLGLEDGELIMRDRLTDARLWTGEEAEHRHAERLRQEAEAQRREVESQRRAREKAEARAQALEAELRQLRGRLDENTS